MNSVIFGKQEFANLDGNSSSDLKRTTWKGRIFFFNYRTKNFLHYFYPSFFVIRRILIGSIFAIWKYDGFMQLLFLSLLSGVTLVYQTSYQPFDSRLRNILCTINEVAYLSVCMTIFPYVYPHLEPTFFIDHAVYVVGIFLAILWLSMMISSIYAIIMLIKKPKKHPVFQKPLNTAEQQTDEDIRKKWVEGEPKKEKPKKDDEEDEPLVDDVKQPPGGPTINEKGGLETEEDLSGTEEGQSLLNFPISYVYVKFLVN